MSDDTAPAAEPEIRHLGDLQRLDLKPGDKFVLTLSSHVSMETADRIKRAFERFAPGVPLLVLDAGMKLGAVRQELDLRTFSDVMSKATQAPAEIPTE